MTRDISSPRLHGWIDPTDAILELHNDGVSVNRITKVLRLSHARVSMVLAEAGKIEPTERIAKAIESGTVPGGKNRLGQTDSAGKNRLGQTDSDATAEIARLMGELESARKAAPDADAIAEMMTRDIEGLYAPGRGRYSTGECVIRALD